jgi:hypothetical protein
MATAFDAKERDRLLAEAEQASQFYKSNWQQSAPKNIFGREDAQSTAAWQQKNQSAMDAYNKANKLRQQAASVDPDSAAGKSEASWQEAMSLLQRQGPYTPEVVNQLTNRRADQSAAAEAVNAEEIRNLAAARGMDPTQAIRGLQQGRQAQNVAFSGDIASQAAVQNFAAETPGRMTAANEILGRNSQGGQYNAVSGGGGVQAPAPQRTAFASQSYNPGAVHQQAAQVRQPVGATAAANAPASQKPAMSVADRNAAQAAWDKSTNYGRTVYGAGHQPGMGGSGRDAQGNLINPQGTLKPNLAVKPATTAFSGGYAGGKQYGSVRTYE